MSMSTRSIHRCLLSVCALLWLVRAEAATSVATPPFERVQLANGATLLLMERRDVPLVAFHALLRGGALSDPENKSGAASLLASLLEKGAGQRDALQFAQTTASVGGVIQTGATLESLAVSGSFLARDQRLMVELLADMLQRPHLPADQFTALRARHIEFLRAAKDSELEALTPLYGAAALFQNHPYGRPVSGSEASLASLERADVQRLYETHVGADRLILAVAGDFETRAMKRLLTDAFQGWRKAGAPAPRPAPPAAQKSQRRVVLVDAPEAVQSYFWMGAPGVARADPRRAALDVVNTLFGGRFTSMLNSELRVRTGLSYGAASSFDRYQHGGSWEMSSFTQTEKTIEALQLTFATLDKLHSAPPPDDLLASSKRYVQGQFPLGFETAPQWAAQLATLTLYELDASYIEQYPRQLEQVNEAAATQVTREVFPRGENVVLVVIGKASAIRESLQQFGPITELKLADPTFTPVAHKP